MKDGIDALARFHDIIKFAQVAFNEFDFLVGVVDNVCAADFNASLQQHINKTGG